ncbi:MAG TPA: heterodisulfide reductase-related iron-sulfur binding cluster [Streptosporangiaceae bacterium]|nr:heterodisulfide reductase-related iron-sulfur binding cluster [Streptosporangiaceae bacterium]
MTASPIDPTGELRGLAADCVHCGFCLPACPTYQLWGEEMDSPRGRIHLITQLLDGAQASETAAEHLDRCLGCMACVPACPSGVRYDRLIEAARSWQEEPQAAPAPVPPRSARARAARAAIFATFPYPRRLRLLTGPLRLAQRTGLNQRIGRSPLAERLAPELVASLRVAPAPGTGQHRLAPGRVPADGPRRAVVGLLTGCVQQVFFPGVNEATARLLSAEGCDVVIPAGQGCCGALSRHSGRVAEAARFARRTIAAFEAADVDVIVVNSAGCGSAMKEYGELFRAAGTGSPAGGDWPARAARTASKVRDLSEYLAELAADDDGPRGARHPLPVTVAYHDACHLGFAQRIRQPPRDLLLAIPGLRLAELADGGTCCGSAGVYNLLEPGAAGELSARKAAAVLATGAPLVASANPGCSLQIASALAKAGAERPPAVVHIAEVLDASLRGLPVSTLTGTHQRHG